MSDPALSRPPFIPEGTFRCCLCFGVFPIEEAHADWEDGELVDVCVPCGINDDFSTFLLGWIMWAGHRGLGVSWTPPDPGEEYDMKIVGMETEVWMTGLPGEDEF